jgi:hypothetical protein
MNNNQDVNTSNTTTATLEYPFSSDPEQTADVFRSLARVDFLVNSIALVLKMANSIAQNPTNMKICFEVLMKNDAIILFQSVINDLYINSQIELSRYKECICSNYTSNKPIPTYVYRLLITGRESIVVKDGPDESSKRVCRYDRGSIVLAYERRLSNNSVIKYRTDDGWISHMKSPSSTDAQVEVIDVLKPTNTTTTSTNTTTTSTTTAATKGASSSSGVPPSATATANTENTTTTSTTNNNNTVISSLKRFNNDKLTNISAARGGLMSFLHFHLTIRNFLIGLSKALYYSDSAGGGGALVFGDYSHEYIDMIMKCCDGLLPPLPPVMSQSQQQQQEGRKTVQMKESDTSPAATTETLEDGEL